jgi:pimeloyl-ACP methyl ester carboxylesterase
LILTGEKDGVVQPKLKADLLALVPYTQHIDMPGLGHAPYFQAPEYYNTLLHEFLAKH